MKKIVIGIVIAVLAVFVVVFALKYKNKIYQALNRVNQINKVQLKSSEPVLAKFSFDFPNENLLVNNFLHINIKINNRNKVNLKKKVLPENEEIPVLLTIETWDNNDGLEFTNPAIAIQKGLYDDFIVAFCREWIGKRKNVYIRLNPEMEVPGEKFPWQNLSPVDYIESHKHLVNLFRKNAPQVKLIWGPAGYPGTVEYYPGNDFVDAVSLTLKSESESILNVYPKDYSIEYDLKRRLHRLRFIDKPVLILGSNNINVDSVNSQVISNISEFFKSNNQIAYSNKILTGNTADTTSFINNKFEFGLHDPFGLLINEKNVTVEHIFTDFSDLQSDTFYYNFHKILERGHKVILTVEPSTIPKNETDLNVLQNILKGNYDKELDHLFSILTSTNQTIYLRFAHEMEIPITRYAWQSKDPVDYIKAFRYFMTYLDPWPGNIKKVWGPAGDRGSIEWYPGNDVVDFISIAIYGLPDKNITDPEKQESFNTIFKRKNWRMRFIDKPIFITEFGVKGPEDYQTEWLIKAAKVIGENPQIVGINYFNMTDTPKAWGEIKPPDWSITKKTFLTFCEELNR